MHTLAYRVTTKARSIFNWMGLGQKHSAVVTTLRVPRLDGETEKLLREIVSNKYHQLGFTELEFEEIQERPFFERALEEKLISVSSSAQTVFVSVGIRRNGYLAIGETPRFTMDDFIDGLIAKVFR